MSKEIVSKLEALYTEIRISHNTDVINHKLFLEGKVTKAYYEREHEISNWHIDLMLEEIKELHSYETLETGEVPC